MVAASILIGKRRHKAKTVKIQDRETPRREGTDTPASHTHRDISPQTAANNDTSRLTGEQLLKRVKELGDVGKSELVRSCGYASIKPDGSERINFTQFYEALLEAKGVSLAATPESGGNNAELAETVAPSEKEISSIDWTVLTHDEIVAKIQEAEEIDSETFEKLLATNYWRVREAIAVHPCTPNVVLR